MQYEVTIKGTSPIIHNNGTAGLDTRSPAKQEIAEISKKIAGNRTIVEEKRLRFLECQVSLWLDEEKSPTIPQGAVRACIEQGARKHRQGSQVREGLMVTSTRFIYPVKHYGKTVRKLSRTAQFTVPVVMKGGNRILRTRAKFDEWECTFTVDIDDELVDKGQLALWLDTAGHRIGLGDWRPGKSGGQYGRFEVTGIKSV